MSKWEEMAKDPQYSIIADAINAGLENMLKWYRACDETSIYFVAHGKCCAVSLSANA